MPKYVIEREVPGAGDLTSEQLQGMSQTSCGVLRNMGPEIQWVHSYVTGNKVYCIYNAPNEEMIKEHATQGGFPANVISRFSPSLTQRRRNKFTSIQANLKVKKRCFHDFFAFWDAFSLF